MSIQLRATAKEPIREAIIGPMFSGKSNLLQEIGRHYEIAQYTVIYVHPKLNTRDTTGVVKTHNGVKFDSAEIEDAKDFDALLDALSMYNTNLKTVVLMDEAQFFPDLGQLLDKCSGLNIDTYFAALNMKYNGEPFESVRDVLHTCTQIKQLYAVCHKCGCVRARYSHRLSEIGGDIVIGGKDDYEALCGPCFANIKTVVEKSPEQRNNSPGTKSKTNK